MWRFSLRGPSLRFEVLLSSRSFTIIASNLPRVAFALSVIALLVTAPANAQEPWADDGFLTDYSKLQPIPGKEGKDFAYIAPGDL